MKKALVTGANGFLGTAVCKELDRLDVETIAIIRDRQENITELENLKNIRIVYLDMSQFRNLADFVPDRNIDVVYHFAWVGTSGPLRGDHEIQLNNVRYACDTVNACRKLESRRFVFASSIMEYEIEELMKTEKEPGINTLYSSAKVAADYMARTLCASLNIEYIKAMITNIYGPGENSPRLINSSIRKMLNNEHCAFSSGEQMYDFVYIDDAAGMFAALGESGVSNRSYYIGSQPKPLKDFLLAMRDQIDRNIEIGLGELGFDGVSVDYGVFDIESVKKDTGYESRVPFDEGIRRTVQWIKKENF